MTGPAGARWLRTDMLRKRSSGVAPEERLGAGAYTDEARARVYDDLFAHAASAFGAGASIIIDATFQEEDMRMRACAIPNAPVTGFWLDAPLEVRLERIAGRAGDASDADVEVAKAQHAPAHLGAGWRRIDARGTVEEVVQLIMKEAGLT